MTSPMNRILLPLTLCLSLALSSLALAEDVESRISDIRAEYNAIQSANLQKQELEWEGEGGEGGGSAILYLDGTELRAVDVNLYYPGHSFAEEHYYFDEGLPFFIFEKKGYWSFVPSDTQKTIDKIWEYRLYLDGDGAKVIRHLEKAYEGHTEDELKQKAGEAANKDVLSEKQAEAAKLVARAKSWLAIKNAAQAMKLYAE